MEPVQESLEKSLALHRRREIATAQIEADASWHKRAPQKTKPAIVFRKRMSPPSAAPAPQDDLERRLQELERKIREGLH